MLLSNELVNGPLATEIAPFIASGNDGVIADILNRKDIVVSGVVSSHDIRMYLMLHDLLIPIESSQSVACQAAKRALEVFPTFDLSNATIFEKFNQILNGLRLDELLLPRFTLAHGAELIALADKKISRAEQLGMTITDLDIRREIWHDDGTRRLP